MKQKLILGTIVALIIIVGVGFYLRASSHPQTKDEAIKQAQEFVKKDQRTCLAVVTKAKHKETGAIYTFGGCLPPGWEVIRS